MFQLSDITRNWTSTFNRLAIGGLALLFLNMVGVVDAFPKEPLSDKGIPLDLERLFLIIGLLFACLLLGMLIIPLGRPTFDKGLFSERSKVTLAARVGATENPLLISLYRDALSKAELAMGTIGLIVFCVVVSIFLAFWDLSNNGVSFLEALNQSPTSQSTAWIAVLISYCFSQWLKKVSSDTLKELDILLKESFPVKNEA